MKVSFKGIFSLALLTSVILSIGLASCNKDKVYDDPDIQFVQEEGFIYTDTVIALGKDIKIGIYMKSNSNQPITHFNRTIDRDGDVSTLENPLFDEELTITTTEPKGIAETEVWSFYCRDRDGRQSETISLTISLEGGALFGDIRIIEELEFGAQSNEEDGSFYSLADEKLYNLTDAYANQGKVDLLYYYDNVDADENTISSPGASISSSIFSGQMGLANWTVRNTTRFIRMGEITRQEFEACANDSLILANTFDFETGNRKAKNLAEGDIYAFVTDKGIQGLFMVKDVEGQETGNTRISLKIKDE
jgi:hypothetical protein